MWMEQGLLSLPFRALRHSQALLITPRVDTPPMPSHAQKRETEAHPSAEIPEDPNPCSKPCWMLNSSSATPGAAQSLHCPLPTATSSTLWCPQLPWHHPAVASPSPGTAAPWHSPAHS